MLLALFLLFFLISPSFSLVCPPEYILVNEQKCLKIVWTPASHWEATQNCTAASGTLVTIKNAIDNRAILNLLSGTEIQEIWLGLSCFGNTASTCFWDNGSGSPILYNNFMGPNITSLYGRCVYMSVANWYGSNQGKWRNINCYNGVTASVLTVLPYVCEAPPTTPSQMFPYSCVNNYNGYCYYTQNYRQTYNIAFTSCAMRAVPNLTSIHSKMEIDYIRNLYKGTNTTMIYIGAQVDSNGRFYWADGSVWDFDYIDPLDFGKGKCLVMDVQGYGLWSRVDCDQQFEFMCKQKIMVPPTSAPVVSDANVFDEKENAEHPKQLYDASNCNSTLYLAPGSISSFGYPAYTASYCTWQLVALGPYRLGIYFDFWATYGTLTIYDEYGNNIGQFMGTYDRTPFPRYTPFNIATVTFEPMPKTGSGVDKGFHAVILPL
ncbi:unnamed protein product [Caenorhabditis brenneri]